MASEVDKTVTAELKAVYDWMHQDGDATPNIVSADTIILMYIAVQMNKLVKLSEDSMKLNVAMMQQLERDDEQSN